MSTFEISDQYLSDLAVIQSDIGEFTLLLEASQNLLFQLYEGRRKLHVKGYQTIAITPSYEARYFVDGTRFRLDALNAYHEGFHTEAIPNPPIADTHGSLLELANADYAYHYHDALTKFFDDTPTIPAFLKRLFDHMPPALRAKFTLQNEVKPKRYEEALQSEKRKLEKEEKIKASEQPTTKPLEKVTPAKPVPKRVPKPITKPVVKKVAPISYDAQEEQGLETLRQEKARSEELARRMKARIGVHYGWEECQIQGENADEMLTALDRKIRKKGLKDEDHSWIVVATYEVSDEDFAALYAHYPHHTFRSDDIAHKPNPLYVETALVVSPLLRKASAPETKRVQSKTAVFQSHAPTPLEHLVDTEDWDEDEPEESDEWGERTGDSTFHPFVQKHKQASVNLAAMESTSLRINNDALLPEEETGDETSTIPSDPLAPEVQEEPIPKRWKCPFCPSRNPWHTEAPAKIITKDDGERVYLCAKHKNAYRG